MKNFQEETLEETAEKESENRYPVLTHMDPNNSPYKGTKETFKHGVRFGAKWQAEQIHDQDYLQGFIDQFGDGELGELSPKEWDALAFLKWLKLNNFEIIKKK